MRVKKTQIQNELFKTTYINNQFELSYLSLSFPPPSPTPHNTVKYYFLAVFLFVMNLKCMIISEKAHGLTLMSYTPALSSMPHVLSTVCIGPLPHAVYWYIYRTDCWSMDVSPSER